MANVSFDVPKRGDFPAVSFGDSSVGLRVC